MLFLISDINATDNIACEVKIRDDPFDGGFQTIRTSTFYCEFNDTIAITTPTTLSNSVNESVTELVMKKNKNIEYMPQGVGVVFPNLEYIDAYGCSVTSLTKLNFKGLTKLINIDLEENRVEKIDANSFEDTVNLSNVYLDYNELSDLPSNVFEKLVHLNVLYLKSNQLINLDAVLFNNNKKLALLHLTNNKLQTLPDGIFNGLTEMRQLWLDGNEIEDLPPHIFDDCNSLIDLDLSRNKIKIINDNWLLKLIPLREVSFSRNPLDFIDLTIFDNNENLSMFFFNGVATKDIRHIEKVDNMTSIKGIVFHDTCVDGQFHEGNLDGFKHSVKENCVVQKT